MLFIDYAASGLVMAGSNFIAARFLANALDDVDPLVGGGGTGGDPGAIPEPLSATLGLMGLGVLGMATRRRVA